MNPLKGAVTLTPEQLDALTTRLTREEFAAFSRPQAGGVLLSPGRLAQDARNRAAQVERQVAALQDRLEVLEARVGVLRSTRRCEACHGSGQVRFKNCAQQHLTRVCPHCNGSGRMPCLGDHEADGGPGMECNP